MAKKDEKKTQKTTCEVIRKITNKDVIGEIVKPTESTDLYTVMGTVYGYDVGNSTYGEFIKFKGEFLAIRKSDGQEFRAPACIIPAPMDMAIAGAYDKAVSGLVDENGELPKGKRASCEMALTIGYKPAATPTGYEWTMRPLIEMQTSNTLDSLKSRVLLLDSPE